MAIFKWIYLDLGNLIFDAIKGILALDTCSFIILIICAHWVPQIAIEVHFLQKRGDFSSIFGLFDEINETIL